MPLPKKPAGRGRGRGGAARGKGAGTAAANIPQMAVAGGPVPSIRPTIQETRFTAIASTPASIRATGLQALPAGDKAPVKVARRGELRHMFELAAAACSGDIHVP